MNYFILLPGDKESELSDANNLGESSFDIFWAGRGLKVLMKVVEKEPELLQEVNIITDKGKKLSVADFLFEIRNLKIRY